jgi:hypothetical protein
MFMKLLVTAPIQYAISMIVKTMEMWSTVVPYLTRKFSSAGAKKLKAHPYKKKILIK